MLRNLNVAVWGRENNFAGKYRFKLFDTEIVSDSFGSIDNILEATEMKMNGKIGSFEGTFTIVTNNTPGTYGAICFLYQSIRKRLLNMFGDEFFMLPSSVHEVIVLPKEKGEVESNVDAIINMVKEINRSKVAESEWLSDTAYKVKLYIKDNSNRIDMELMDLETGEVQFI